MALTKIIFSLILITYGSNASIFDTNSDKLPLGPYFDTLGEYYVEDPLMDAYSEQVTAADSDYEDADWEHEGDIAERQLPESGELKLNQAKKSQILCKVKKVIKHHYEPGFDFFPPSYSEYDCIPHSRSDGFSKNSIFSSEVCAVNDVKCKPLQKTFMFFKWPQNAKSTCTLMKVEKTVNVGCHCVNHVKYHFL